MPRRDLGEVRKRLTLRCLHERALGKLNQRSVVRSEAESSDGAGRTAPAGGEGGMAARLQSSKLTLPVKVPE
jgi:hypothetical protein